MEFIKPAAAVFCFVIAFCISARGQANCLPDGVDENDIAAISGVPPKKSGSSAGRSTVRTTLKAIGARCSTEKLIDRRGRRIRFYFLKGCWGNPPADYLEILDRQRDELKRLRKRSTVIEISCDGKIDPSQVDWPQDIAAEESSVDSYDDGYDPQAYTQALRRSARVRISILPPSGRASTALKMRFVSASRISFSAPRMAAITQSSMSMAFNRPARTCSRSRALASWCSVRRIRRCSPRGCCPRRRRRRSRCRW